MELTWDNGQVVDIGLNGAPLLSQIRYQPFGPPTAWFWNNGVEYRRAYDLDGRLLQLPLAQGQRNIAYDAASRVFEFTDSDPLFNWAYTYDPLHRLLSAESPSQRQTFEYDANGNRLSQDGLTYVYPASGNRLLQRGEIRYETDAAGNITSDGRRRFDYDPNNRLTRAETDGASFAYRYDGFGTRAVKWQGHAPDMAGDVDRDGRFGITDARRLALMARGAIPPSHNADCDHDGAISSSDVSCVLQKIFDQRTHPENYSQRGTLFVYDEGGHLLGEYQRDGQLIQEIVWLDDQPVAVLKPDPNNRLSSQIYFIYADHLNTPRAIVDGSGQLVWRWESDPFGTGPADEDPDQNGEDFEFNLRFPGQYYDKESSLHYNMARYYDPETGRYLQPDPVGLDSDTNLFSYVGNDPLSQIDPDGRWVWWAAGGALLLWDISQPIQTDPNHPDAISPISTLPGPLNFAKKAGLLGKICENAVEREVTAIGRLKDLQNLQPGQRSLLGRLPELNSPKVNWKQNSGVLRNEMAKGRPILDVSPGDISGKFLNAERNVLRNHGWNFNDETKLWMPPN